MAIIPRIDRLLPGLFEGPSIDDERAAEIVRQMNARGRFDDVGAVAARWEKFSPYSKLRFNWFLTVAQQARLWGDPQGVLGSLPPWKRKALEALEALAGAAPLERLPPALQEAGRIQGLGRRAPEIVFLTKYAGYLEAEEQYRRGTAGEEGIVRIAYALKGAADLAEKLPTRNYAEVQRNWEFRISLYQRSRGYYLDGAGAAGITPQRRGQFLQAIKMRLLRGEAALQLGASLLAPKRGKGEGSNGGGSQDGGSLPPFGMSGLSGSGTGGGMNAAAAPSLPGVRVASVSGALMAVAAVSTAAAFRVR